jgi:MFS family permease
MPAANEFRWTRTSVIALTVLCLAALLDTIDVTVVNVAMPTIRNDLHFTESGLAWMVNAYMVPFGGFLLLGGRAGDMLGRRRTLLGGTVLFTVASLASGLAHNTGMMIASRAAQGVGAAFVIPMTMAMLASVFPSGAPRNRAFAVWGATGATAGTLGLIAGGLLVSAAGWRWIFFINVPVGVFVLIAAMACLPADHAPFERPEATPGELRVAQLGERPGVTADQRRGVTAGGRPEVTAAGRPEVTAAGRRGFDAVGALTATAGAGLLAYAVVQTGDHGWGSGRTVGLLAAAMALIGYFVIHEGLVARTPLIPLSLCRNRSVTGANVVSVLQSSAIFAMFYSTTLYMQQVLHYSALSTGLAYVPLGVSILVAAALGPVLVPRIGVRYTIVIGSVVGTAGMVLLTRISPAGRLLQDVIVPTVVVGIGAGMIFIPASIAALFDVPAERHGVASALLNVSRQLGGAIGLAVIATVVTSRTTGALATGRPAAVALTDGFHQGFAVSAILMAGAAVAAVLLLRDEGRGQTVNLAELQQAGAPA